MSYPIQVVSWKTRYGLFGLTRRMMLRCVSGSFNLSMLMQCISFKKEQAIHIADCDPYTCRKLPWQMLGMRYCQFYTWWLWYVYHWPICCFFLKRLLMVISQGFLKVGTKTRSYATTHAASSSVWLLSLYVFELSQKIFSPAYDIFLLEYINVSFVSFEVEQNLIICILMT